METQPSETLKLYTLPYLPQGQGLPIDSFTDRQEPSESTDMIDFREHRGLSVDACAQAGRASQKEASKPTLGVQLRMAMAARNQKGGRTPNPLLRPLWRACAAIMATVHRIADIKSSEPR